MRAEQISSQYLRSNMGQGSTQTAVSGREASLALTLCISDYANLLHVLASSVVLKALEAVYWSVVGFIRSKQHSNYEVKKNIKSTF